MAERVAKEENRTKSELVREALRLYVDTREVRKAALRDRLFAVVDRAQERARSTPGRKIRKLVAEAVGAVRSRKG